MRRSIYALLCCCVALALAVGPGFGRAAAATSTAAATDALPQWWTVQKVDGYGQYSAMGPQSVRFDVDDAPHVVYGGDGLYHAWFDGAAWHKEMVDHSAGAGSHASLALDAANRAHISYYNATSGDLMYARWTGSTWSIGVVDSAGDVGRYSSLALDSTGDAHIAYYDAGNGDLKYASGSGAGWTIAIVDGVGDTGQFASLAFDQSDQPHISYYDASAAHLRYARWSGGGWTLQTVDSDGDTGRYSSLALDGTGNPHVSYAYVTPAPARTLLRYARWTGTSWATETIETGGWAGSYTSLALDAAGRAHIGSFDANLLRVQHTYWDGAAWKVNSPENAGMGTVRGASLAMDSLGNAALVYYWQTGGALRYAQWSGSAWATSTVAGTSFVGRHSSIALDARGNPAISYEDGNAHALRYAEWDGAGWSIAVVDTAAPGSAPYVGQFTSLVIDSEDNPHISYHDDMAHSLKYARRSSGSWLTQTVDGPPLVVQGTSLALDADGNPHIAYAGYWSTVPGVYSQRLSVASWTGSAWSIETVTTSTLNALPSLAIDAAGNPYISFHDDSDRHLKLASRLGATWDIQTVDSGYQTGLYSSLALDEAGRPHVSYFDSALQRVKYAHWTGSTWDIQVIGAAQSLGQQTSLRLDSSGAPAIAYVSSTGPVNGYGLVTYARWDGDGWRLATVGNVRDPREPALVLSEAGAAHFSYFDPNPDQSKTMRGGLTYARLDVAVVQVHLPLIVSAH